MVDVQGTRSRLGMVCNRGHGYGKQGCRDAVGARRLRASVWEQNRQLLVQRRRQGGEDRDYGSTDGSHEKSSKGLKEGLNKGSNQGLNEG